MTNPAFINRINKSNKPSCQITLIKIHSRDIRNNESIVMPNEFKVIRRAGRRPNQLVKSEQRCFTTRLRDLNLAAPDNLGSCVRRVIDRVAQEIKPLAGVLVGVFT